MWVYVDVRMQVYMYSCVHPRVLTLVRAHVHAYVRASSCCVYACMRVNVRLIEFRQLLVQCGYEGLLPLHRNSSKDWFGEQLIHVNPEFATAPDGGFVGAPVQPAGVGHGDVALVATWMQPAKIVQHTPINVLELRKMEIAGSTLLKCFA